MREAMWTYVNQKQTQTKCSQEGRFCCHLAQTHAQLWSQSHSKPFTHLQRLEKERENFRTAVYFISYFILMAGSHLAPLGIQEVWIWVVLVWVSDRRSHWWCESWLLIHQKVMFLIDVDHCRSDFFNRSKPDFSIPYGTQVCFAAFWAAGPSQRPVGCSAPWHLRRCFVWWW